MLWAPPPMTSTEPPGRCSSWGTTVRQASERLSPAAATRSGSTPSGTGTSMWSAYGTRISSATMPPHGPLAGPNPYAASSPTRVVEHLAVMPRRHSVQEPHETAHGTTTICPMARSVTSSPLATTWPTHSCPMPNGPRNGTGPRMEPTAGSIRPSFRPSCSARDTGRWMGSVSPSQRAATNGRTRASRGPVSVGAGFSRHSSRPRRMNCSSRTGPAYHPRPGHGASGAPAQVARSPGRAGWSPCCGCPM